MAVENAWMDDDEIEMTKSAQKSAQKSPRRKLSLDRFTTDVFCAIPCSPREISTLVQTSARKLWELRRYGESISSAVVPDTVFSSVQKSGAEWDLSLNRESDRAYRELIFDWCKEIATEIFAEEPEDQDEMNLLLLLLLPNPFKKPIRLSISTFAKRPPRTVEDLANTLQAEIDSRLNWKKTDRKGTREKMVARKRLDKVDEMLLAEMYAEEPNWCFYDKDELELKQEMTTEIWKFLIDEAVTECLNAARV